METVLDKIINSNKEARYRELVNNLIDYVNETVTDRNTISVLLDHGFKKEELINDFNFIEDEVNEA